MTMIKRLGKPLIEYEVLISLERHLDLSGHTIDLAGVKFFQMSQKDILDWGIDRSMSAFHKQFYDAVVSKPVALMYEKCHSSDEAMENARIKLNTALNMLRIALLIDHDPRIISWRIWDEQLLFHADEESALREKGKPSTAHLGFESGFRSWQLLIDDTYAKQIVDSKRLLDGLFLGHKAQSKIYGRLRRALEWIGGSVTREHLDDKIVDICTALETLLTTRQDGRKGEAISLRMMLLYSHLKVPFFDPVKLFEIYKKRSDIVHGSNRGICSDSEYKSAQWIAGDVFKKVLTYIQTHNITQHSDFIEKLESDRTTIEKSVDFWKSTPYYKDITIFVSKVFEERFQKGNP